MDCPVTIALVRGHGVRQVLVYCRGKRADNWPCHHPGGRCQWVVLVPTKPYAH